MEHIIGPAEILCEIFNVEQVISMINHDAPSRES